MQGRSPLQLTLPLPLPTVGELKRRLNEACAGARTLGALALTRRVLADAVGKLVPLLRTDLAPERQRLVYAGQILAPDEKDLALYKARPARRVTDTPVAH